MVKAEDPQRNDLNKTRAFLLRGLASSAAIGQPTMNLGVCQVDGVMRGDVTLLQAGQDLGLPCARQAQRPS